MDWNVKVLEVSDDGTITISIPGTLLSTVSLKGISLEIAKTINKNSYIRFTGVMDNVIDFLGLHIYIVDGRLIE